MRKQLAVAIVSYMFILLWSKSYKISCFSLIIPFSIGIILFINTYVLLKERKICISSCYFKKDTFLYKLFNRKLLITIISIFSSAFLTLSLSIAAIRFDIIDIIIYGLDILLLVYLYNRFKKMNIFNENIKYPVLKNMISWLNSTIVAILYIFISLFQTPPSYISNDLLTTIQQSSIEVASNCPYIDYFSQIVAKIVAAKWWIMLYLTQKINNLYLNQLLWIIFLIGNYIAIFAFGRFITETVYIFTKKFDKEEIQ